jgi:hypothetical protein
MKRFFKRVAGNIDFVADNENNRMSQEQLNTFLEIINSHAASKVAKRLFGNEDAVRSINFIQWIERAIRADLFADGAPFGEEELLNILQKVPTKPMAKNLKS